MDNLYDCLVEKTVYTFDPKKFYPGRPVRVEGYAKSVNVDGNYLVKQILDQGMSLNIMDEHGIELILRVEDLFDTVVVEQPAGNPKQERRRRIKFYFEWEDR